MNMSDSNKRNLQYFKAPSMGELFSVMNSWQEKNNKRFLSMSVERDADMFCCIALTNPSEVIIMDGSKEYGGVDVTDSALKTYS